MMYSAFVILRLRECILCFQLRLTSTRYPYLACVLQNESINFVLFPTVSSIVSISVSHTSVQLLFYFRMV